MGRHSEYTDQIGKEICEMVSKTPMGLGEICKKNPHFPAFQTIYDWRNKFPHFDEMYARAKAKQIEAFVEQIIDIADDVSADYYVNDEGKKVLDNEHIQRSRLRIDTRKWLAAKLAPKIYGTKTIEIGAEESLLEKIIDKL